MILSCKWFMNTIKTLPTIEFISYRPVTALFNLSSRFVYFFCSFFEVHPNLIFPFQDFERFSLFPYSINALENNSRVGTLNDRFKPSVPTLHTIVCPKAVVYRPFIDIPKSNWKHWWLSVNTTISNIGLNKLPNNRYCFIGIIVLPK